MSYFRNIAKGFKTTAKGMSLTWKHLWDARFTRGAINVQDANYFVQDVGHVTLQFPHETIGVPDNGRYQLDCEIDDCIVCDKCAKICPVDCIEIEAIKSPEIIRQTSDGSPVRLYAAKFDIDMAKCCFCGLCTTVCPTECLTMNAEYDYSTFDIRDLNFAFANLSAEEAQEKRLMYEQFVAEKEAAKKTATETPKVAISTETKRPAFVPKIKPAAEKEEVKIEQVPKPAFRPTMKPPVSEVEPVAEKTDEQPKPKPAFRPTMKPPVSEVEPVAEKTDEQPKPKPAFRPTMKPPVSEVEPVVEKTDEQPKPKPAFRPTMKPPVSEVEPVVEKTDEQPKPKPAFRPTMKPPVSEVEPVVEKTDEQPKPKPAFRPTMKPPVSEVEPVAEKTDEQPKPKPAFRPTMKPPVSEAQPVVEKTDEQMQNIENEISEVKNQTDETLDKLNLTTGIEEDTFKTLIEKSSEANKEKGYLTHTTFDEMLKARKKFIPKKTSSENDGND